MPETTVKTLQPSSARAWVCTAAAGLLVAIAVSLGWAGIEAWQVSAPGGFFRAFHITSAHSLPAALLSMLLSLPIVGAWLDPRLGGRLRRVVAARPRRGQSLVLGWFALVASSLLTFAAALLFNGAFSSPDVRAIALAVTVPGIALLVAVLAWRADLRLRQAFQDSPRKRLLLLSSAAAALLLWAICFVALAPGVFEALEARTFVPFAVSVFGALCGGLLGARILRRPLVVVALAAGALAFTGFWRHPSDDLRTEIDRKTWATKRLLRMRETFAQPRVPVRPSQPTAATCWGDAPIESSPNVGRIEAGSPDIVLLTIDAMRWDHTSLSGYERATTPALKRHGKRAAVFRAYTPAASTRQTFRTLFTGMFPALLPRDERSRWALRIPEGQPTLAGRLREAGYRTSALITTDKIFPDDEGGLQGFEHVDRSPGAEQRRWKWRYSAPYVVDRLLAELSSVSDRPRFLWAHLMEPHHPYLSGPGKPAFGGKRDVDRYDSALAFVDGEIDRLLAFAQRPDRRKRTLVILTADHGEGFGEHGNRFHASTVHEEEIRVPLLVWGPGIVPRHYETPVSLVDLPRTVFGLVGLEAPAEICGRTLAPAILRGEEPDAALIYVEQLPDPSHDHFNVAFLNGPVKLVLHPTRGTKALYLLDQDPGEERNLAAERPELVAAHLDELRRFHRRHGIDPASYGLEDEQP